MMLVVVAYDVNTEIEGGSAAAAGGEGLRRLWPAGAEIGI